MIIVEELFNELHEDTIFSKLNLRLSYHQIHLRMNDIHKLLFQMQHDHYKFLVMSFGLWNALSTFQILINKLFIF